MTASVPATKTRVHPESLKDDTASIQAITTENGTAFVLTRNGETREVSPIQAAPVTPEKVYTLTPRAKARLDEEMAAGKRRIEHYAELQANQAAIVRSQKEAQAEGSTTPVFRPGDFMEYAKQFAQPGQTKSKDGK